MTDSEKAITILEQTHDGDDLDPTDLFLVQSAVNGYLTEHGRERFESLYDVCRRGEYSQPWFHGIEHMTIDTTGYVHWKGEPVEHYNPEWAYTEEARREAVDLAQRCRHLQAIGEVPSLSKTVWHWDKYRDKQPLTK